MSQAARRASLHDLKVLSLNQMMGNPAFQAELDVLASKISRESMVAPNEATVVSNFERSLYGFLRDAAGLDFAAQREIQIDVVDKTGRRLVKGRMDSRIGALVIEYKHYSTLLTASHKARVLKQITGYLTSVYKETRKAVVGIVTDGVQAQVVQADDDGQITSGAFEPLNRGHLERVITSAVLLGQTALTPENLVADFCGKNDVAYVLARALFSGLSEGCITPRSKMLFTEWRSLFHLAHDDTSKQKPIRERRQALSKVFEVRIAEGDNDTEYKALYALQTAYAIIVKAIALNVLSSVKVHRDLISFKRQAGADSDAIRSKLARIEDGDLLRQIGFGNLLEGDFFAWYCTPEQWREDSIGAAVKQVFGILARYEDQPFLSSTETACDFFKDLYMAVMPDKVRHSLGEFYTPPWLADQVVDRAISLRSGLCAGTAWRGIDPCCGSGTFVTTMLRKKLAETKEWEREERLHHILNTVNGIDLNPLAVLTARINYFINIASLLADGDKIEIPVYLGDASYVPEAVDVDGVACLKYQVSTMMGALFEEEDRNGSVNAEPSSPSMAIDVVLPKSALKDLNTFSRAMSEIEVHIKARNAPSVLSKLKALCDAEDLNQSVIDAITKLSEQFVRLEKNKWNGIWARIVANFLTTASLGRFDVVVGNPPWIDWRNLPSNYRDRIKGLCLDRSLFSGDGRTGGINLNVCALITNVVAGNWLEEDGVLGFLMPDTLLYQNTYRGFRELRVPQGVSARFVELHDWTAAGQPFAPVSQNFFTYYIGTAPVEKTTGIPVARFVKKPNEKIAWPPVLPLAEYRHEASFCAVEHVFQKEEWIATAISNDVRKGFAISPVHSVDTDLFDLIAGTCEYRGRQGLEFYPKDVFMLSFERGVTCGKGLFSKPTNRAEQFLLETDFMFPLVQGSKLSKFATPTPDFFVPFPYGEGERAPIPSRNDETAETLADRAFDMMTYFQDHQRILNAQSAHNSKIIGKENAEFYAIPRVGAYTFAEHFVAFRDNTRWGACVISSQMTPWGEEKRPLFQKHAATISQRPDDTFISLHEAHYLCAIINSPVVERFILASNDKRSFKIKLSFKIPLFDSADSRHRKLSNLSKIAHEFVAQADPRVADLLEVIGRRADNLYLDILRTDIVETSGCVDMLEEERVLCRNIVAEAAVNYLIE